MSAPDFRIVPATEDDVPLILQFIRGLAEFEERAHEVVATEERIRETLFGNRPAAEVVIAYAGDVPAGFALFFFNYSTYLGRPGLYLEDLFVRPEWRGRGLGRRLLVYLARLAEARGCGWMEWSVLKWNREAMGFYEKLGARAKDAWNHYFFGSEALARLAAVADE